eukprot:64184_1
MLTLPIINNLWLLIIFISSVESHVKPQFSTQFETYWSFLREEPKLTLNDYISKEPTDPYQVIYDLMTRVFTSSNNNPNLINQFKLELIESDHTKQNNRYK